jgi:hypothetical protein
MVYPPLSMTGEPKMGSNAIEENAEQAARRAAHDVENVERINADVAYLCRPPGAPQRMKSRTAM